MSAIQHHNRYLPFHPEGARVDLDPDGHAINRHRPEPLIDFLPVEP